MGHELTHGFDSIGRDIDINGNYVKWWEDDSIEEFNNKTFCFINQFNKYKVCRRSVNFINFIKVI